MNSLKIGIIILSIAAVLGSGCTTSDTGNNTNHLKTFDKGGISFSYPQNWTEMPLSEDDKKLTAQAGFEQLGKIMEGNELKDYTVYVGIAELNITDGNFQEAASRLYKTYISTISSDYLNITNITLKNGYTGYEYVHGGAGALSGRTLDIKTYVFTKDNKTVYYIQFATPRGGFESNQGKFQAVLDSVIIT